MKKLAIGLVAILALSLAACAPTTTSGTSGAKPSLLLWVDTPRVPQAQAYKKLMAGKEDIKIEVIAQADAQTKIALHNQTKSGWPDVIFGTASDTAQFVDPSNGYAADLTHLVSKKVMDGFGVANDYCKFNGKFYCLKNDLAQTVLWYNTKIFKQLGLTVPTTMDEFAATAMKLKGTGYSAGAIGDENYWASFLQSSSCPLSALPSKNTVRIAPNAPECTRVAQLAQPLLDAGVLDKRSSFDAGFIKNVAKKDKVAMTLGPSWFGDFVIKAPTSWGVPAGEIAAAPQPKWDGADTNTSGAWGGGVFTVSSHSKFPQAAADAAVWLTTSAAATTPSPTFPAYGPANKLWETRIAADPYYASNVYTPMSEQAPKIDQVNRPVRFAFEAQVGTKLQADINSGKSLETALNDFATSLQQLAPQSGYKVVTE
ncbi:ABC transporter substrate-binding protein [Diaminobutyricibacter sp. McL0608]|uniref:ABC transporter substrate-binding protein n=1 Tax=Leifsonia sp. McL0608 TaxID=3143537 RepID=UPI0031F30994